MFRSIANVFVALNGSKQKSKKKKRRDGDGSSSKTDNARGAVDYLKKYSKRGKKGDAGKSAKEGDMLSLEEYYWDLDNVDMTILLEIVYAKHNTDLLDKIHVILSKFEDEEILLLQQLCQRYKITYDEMRDNINKTRIAVERKGKKKGQDGNKNGNNEVKKENGEDERKSGVEESSDDEIDIVDDASTVDGNTAARGVDRSENRGGGESKYERKVLSRGNNPMMDVMSQLTNTLQKPKEETLKHVQHHPASTLPPPPPPQSNNYNKPPPPPPIITPMLTPVAALTAGENVVLNPNPNPNPEGSTSANSYKAASNPSQSSPPSVGASLYEQNKRDIESKRKDKEIEILRNELEFAKQKLEESNRETREILKTLNLLSESTRQLSNSSLNGSSVYSKDHQNGPETYAPFTSHDKTAKYNDHNNNSSSSHIQNSGNSSSMIGNELIKSELEVMKKELMETRKFISQLANDVNFSAKKQLPELVSHTSTIATLFNGGHPDSARKSLTAVNTAANSTPPSPTKERSLDGDNWCELYDPKSQKKYYYNTSTRRSVWQLPSEAGAAAGTGSSSSRRASSAPRGSAAAASPASRSLPATPYTTDARDNLRSPQQTPLGFPPLNWGDNTTNLSPIYRSTSPARGKSTNEKGRFAPVPKEKQQKIVPKVEVHRTLYDKSWVAAVDPRTLRKYYYNRLTKESVWQKPLGFEPE